MKWTTFDESDSLSPELAQKVLQYIMYLEQILLDHNSPKTQCKIDKLENVVSESNSFI